MNMDNLEPWNMFTNDFVAEETDEILTGDFINEYHADPSNLQDIKLEPLNTLEESDGNFDIRESNGNIQTERNESDENIDDNTIFNFGFDAVTQSKGISPPPLCAEVSNDSSETPIDFEAAIVYICPACGAEFKTQSTWKKHLNNVHDYNTRKGLNFRKVDRLYHKCLECHKNIAMHAMENLLKHKFTHLPYRCTKCKICLRQYKYRQDLMIHLKMIHKKDLSEQCKDTDKESASNGESTIENQYYNSTMSALEIQDVQENAFDIFDSTNDMPEVKSEPIDPDEIFFENMTSQQTQQGDSDQQGNTFPIFSDESQNVSSSLTNGTIDEEVFQKYISYICPQCGTENQSKQRWRTHIETAHGYGSRRGLNFREINRNKYAQCIECDMIIYVNVIHQLQIHKFTHLPFKQWMRCNLCSHCFAKEKHIQTHLQEEHYVGLPMNSNGRKVQNESFDQTTAFDTESNPQQLLKRYKEENYAETPKEKSVSYDLLVLYLCPECGKTFNQKKFWRSHLLKIHNFNDLDVLRFTVINDRQVKCLECSKVITNAYGLQNAQQHRITHLPYKAFIRCRLCTKSYTDRKGLIKHLQSVHHINDEKYCKPSAISSPLPLTTPLPNKCIKMKVRPPNEIVRHANYTYEIIFLDDSDEMNDDSHMNENYDDRNGNSVGKNNDDNILDDEPVPELMFDENFQSLLPFKCTDCGSIFSSQRELHQHIKKEHEFINYNNTNKLSDSHNEKIILRPDTNQRKRRFSYNENQKLNIGENVITKYNYENFITYLCPACGIESRCQSDWRRHINEVHNFDKRSSLDFTVIGKYRYKCVMCKDVITNSKLKALQDHKFRHLPYKLYIKCLLCGTCYNHKPNMLSHLKMRHNMEDSSNAYEMKANETVPLQKPSDLQTVEDCISYHNSVDHSTITYHCPQCNMGFDTHVHWRKHIVDAHNFNSREGLNFRQVDKHHYLCLECYKRVTVTHTKGAIGQLQSHKFRHLPYKSFSCLKCKGDFVRKQMYFKHLNKATGACAAPSTQNENNGALEVSINNVNSILNQADFDVTNNLDGNENRNDNAAGEGDSNMVTNEDVNQLVKMYFYLICPVCGERYETWRLWREHINVEHNLGKRENLHLRRINKSLHECLECGEVINGNKLRDLQTHRFKHLPFDDYLQCKYCDSTYHHVGNIKTHLRQKHLSELENNESVEESSFLCSEEEAQNDQTIDNVYMETS